MTTISFNRMGRIARAKRLKIGLAVGAVTLLAALTAGVVPASAGGTLAQPAPLYMPNAGNVGNPALQPPPICCVPGYESLTGKLPVPTPINMAYFGGWIQQTPKVYLVLWGWGEPGAFDHATPGLPANDPDGAGARMTAFLKAFGGTHWAGVSTQYYQTNADGSQSFIQNPVNQFGGVWWDDTDPIHNDLSYHDLAAEAERGAAHFGITDLKNSQVVVAQPQMYNDAQFNAGAGYCAWHDLVSAVNYPDLQPGLSFTNMPYVLNSGTSCGENSVNTGYFAGRLDGFTIVLGHEVEETITDPGAETTLPDGTLLGGWYDLSGWENGDKCAWTGYADGALPAATVPGGLQNITGNDGKLYPIQTLWSNQSAAGAGYCAGGSNDLPG